MSDEREHLILVGAEGVVECLDRRWFREAALESERFCTEKGITEERREQLTLDRTGRPYFLCAVRDDAPPAALERARTHLRVVRLLP